MGKTQKIALALSIIPQIILVKALGTQPEWVEQYFSEGIYHYVAQFQRFLFGWIPFSVGDVFYTLLAFAIIRYLYLQGKNLWRRPKSFLLDLGCALSVGYFIFHMLWGMNYYRLPINEKMNFDAEYSKEDLVNFTFKLVKMTNTLRTQIPKDSIREAQLPYSVQEVYEKTLVSYEMTAKVFPDLEYKWPSLKSSLYSKVLTYMGYGGYLNPFTNEAQVNKIVPTLRLPSISAHEIGHQLGYSSESSTNFIGLLVASANPDIYFQYAAQSHGLAYCLSDLRRRDKKAFSAAYDALLPAVKEDYKALNRFWDQYENPTEPIFKAMFNAFLKANNQKEGIKSYNAVVGLLIGFDKAYQ
ncbi:MAG: DUF3810 domain-containing protein [Croceivirga sp.]